jgi:parallel beta-helix repeat protein
MFLPWSLITRESKKQDGQGASRRLKKHNKLRRAMKLEALEDRVVPANYIVDALYDGSNGTPNGDLDRPFLTIQDGLNAARNNPGPDKVFVYGNNSINPALAAYVWTHDEDNNWDGLLDGNMMVGDPFDATNTVELYLRASVRNVFSADGGGGAASRLVVKMRDNLIDVLGGSMLRLEGSNDAARVIVTSIFDDTAGGDTNGDGDINAPQRANWGGIRYRADAIDQGPTTATGSLVNFADIRYTGETLFDEVAGFFAEFGSVRMEANATNAANVRSAQVRVWNTIFQHGGRALDVNVNALGRGGKATSVETGPDLGAATGQPLTFIDNTINGAFVFIPTDVFTGFIQQMYPQTRLDDVGVPYVITARWVLAHPQTTPGLPQPATLTFDAGTILKAQNTGLDGIDFGEANDRTFGNIRVNGTVNRPTLFTSLSDDALIANTDLAALYNNGSADTNNDGATTTPAPGDWGGIRIAQGWIDHSVVRFGGGQVQTNGTFSPWPAIRVFARDLTPYGQNKQQVRVANTEVTETFSFIDPNDPNNNVDSPAIDLFNRDDGDSRYNFGLTPLRRAGDVQIMDNFIHNNQGKSIQAHPMYFDDARNTLGGYGVYIARNIIDQNANNGLFIPFVLDQSRAIDRNLPSAGAVWDDSDIVHVFDGQALVVHPDQFFQIMSQRGVLPDPTSGGYLQKFSDLTTFLSNLKLRLPGNLPTNTTLPMELPLQQGPFGVNGSLVDSGLFYYLTNFNTTSRNVATAAGSPLRGEEWRDWGVDFVYTGDKTNLVDSLGLFPFTVAPNPFDPAHRIFTTNTLNGDGSFEMVFPDQASAVGFYVHNNTVTNPNEKIELFASDGRLIDSFPLPTTAPNGRTFFGRISKTPIHKIRVTEEAGDNTAANSVFTSGPGILIPDNNTAVDVPLTVGPNYTIADVNVTLNITHARASDLRLELVAPDNTVVLLKNPGAVGVTGANFTNTYLDDSATLNIDLGSAPFTGAFSSANFDPFAVGATGLGVLNGKTTGGTWKLRVTDTRIGNGGTVNNYSLTFKNADPNAAKDLAGISALTWVLAPAGLVAKANDADSLITAGGVRAGYGGITQDAAGVITNGFVPQMSHTTTGAGAAGMFTFGQSTNTSFTATGPTALVNGGSTLIPINVTNDFIPYDMTLTLNMVYSGSNTQLRVRLRAPDGTEIDLVSPGQDTNSSGYTNKLFDDRADRGFPEAPAANPVQSSSFTVTRRTNPTLQTPWGMSFYRGKNARGQWVLVIDKQDGQTGTFNNATLSFRGVNSGWGATLRILGQGNAPVILTGLQDDSAGAGPVGHVQFDNGSDGPTTAQPGQWRGVQVLAGNNSSLSEVVIQNPNGTLNRRYADLNPYTRGDEGVLYPGITNTAGLPLSTQDEFITDLSALSAGTTVATRAPFDVRNFANVQDGTLIEYADIRFATTGIDQRSYPRNKLTIDGNEWEPSRTEPNVNNDGNPTLASSIIQPTPLFSTNDRGQIRFTTIDGSYTVAGAIGKAGENALTGTNDVDWYQLDNPSQAITMYVDVVNGSRTNGNEEPNGARRPFNVAVYDSAFTLLYWSGGPGGQFTAPNLNNAGNTVGPIVLQPGDQVFAAPTFPVDAKYIAIMPPDRIPRSFVNSNVNSNGLGQDTWVYSYGAFPATPVGADGGSYTIFAPPNPLPVNPANDYAFYPTGGTGNIGSYIGGYEMRLRMAGAADSERHTDPPQPTDGQILIRSNTISNSAFDGISLRDLRVGATNANLGVDLPLQAARFPFTATNLAVNSNTNPFRNEDVNTVNPQFSAPANFVPGPTVHNNLVIRNGGDGIVLREDRTSNNVVAGPTGLNIQNPVAWSSNAITPTAFTPIFNNTIEGNSGVGINIFTRGGPTIENNIVANNSGGGLSVTDGYDILTNTPPVVPVVSYNIFFNNSVNASFTGSNNIIGSGPAQDPQFVDPAINDYRVRLASPAVDSGISELQDRLRSVRFPQLPTRAPSLDLRGRSRVDNPSRPNVGAGAFPFYDRGALETNELALRVIGVSVLTDTTVVGEQVSSITIVFSGRVDTATFNTSTVIVHRDTPTGPAEPYLPQLTTNTYDINADTHTFTLTFANPLPDRTYWLELLGTGATGIKDIAGQLLDGELPPPYKLPSGNGAPGGTLLLPFTIRTGKVSGTVWLNPDGDTTIDAGEGGIGGAQVELIGAGDDGILFNGDDELVATVTTDASGGYLFNNVASGRFYVQVDQSTLPANYRLNTPPAQKVVNLPIGGIRANVNFGFWIDNATGQVNGRVFDDINGNGQIDAGEPALRDPSNPNNPLPLTLTLVSGGDDFNLNTPGDNETFFVLTDANGNYSFNGLTGNNYRLSVDESPIPPTYTRTSPVIVPVEFFLLPDTFRSQNFGFQEKQATVTGLVFSDANGNAQLDGGETGISGVTVRLLGAGIDGLFGTSDDLPTLTVATDGSGVYTFNPLTAGTYQVQVDSSSPVLANYFLTTNNSTQTVVLPNGNTTVSANPVGYRLDPFQGQILGLVFNDQNANGQFDVGEPGFGGININLRWAGRNGIVGDSDDQMFTATTAGSGAFSSTNLPVGDFYVEPTNPPAGFGRTTPATVPVKVTLGYAGIDSSTAFFGYQAANSSISGVVFGDVDGDGILDAGEGARFGGVRVFLDNNSNGSFDANEQFAVSAAGTGAYTIGSLPTGTYRVMIDTATLPPSVPAGFVPSTGTLVVNLGPSSNVVGQNLGMQQRNAQVVGRVFIDSNSNGIFDVNEVGSPGQTVTLTFTGTPVPANFPNPRTFVTAADGTFTFAGLPQGNYSVQTTVPSGGQVPANPGNPQTFFLTAGGSTSRLFPVQFPQGASAGVWYLSFTTAPSTTLFNSDGSTTVVTDRDIVRMTAPQAGEWRYDVLFSGGLFGLAGGVESIDAFTFTNTGDVIVSTRGAFSVQTDYSGGFGSGAIISGFGEDLLRFTPAAPNFGGGFTDGTWSLFFKGSRVGMAGTSENVDAVSLIYSGNTLSRILLSTAGTALVNGGISAQPYDVLAFAPKNFGAQTSGTFSRHFTGSSRGLNVPSQENIDALFYLPNPSIPSRPSLFISTNGSFTVPGFTGTSDDILRFNATGGGPSGTLTGTAWAGIALDGSSFGHGGRNVTGFYQGTTPSDPNPFGGNQPPQFLRSTNDGGTFMAALSASSGSTSTTGSTTKSSLIAAKGTAAKVAAGTTTTAKTGSQQADSFFTTSKRQRSSVSALAASLLSNLTSLKS